jgi:hypothetical protein
MMILSAAGMIWGCIRREDDAMIAITLYLCIVVAHSISFPPNFIPSASCRSLLWVLRS